MLEDLKIKIERQTERKQASVKSLTTGMGKSRREDGPRQTLGNCVGFKSNRRALKGVLRRGWKQDRCLRMVVSLPFSYKQVHEGLPRRERSAVSAATGC